MFVDRRPALELATVTAIPPASGERIVGLDALRGFALVGILVVNLVSFSGLYSMSWEQQMALPTAAIDQIVFPLVGLLFVGKFYSLFSLLFGIGFAIQLRTGTPSKFRRRMLVLLLIGLLHAAIWFGDILVLYAVLGFLLVPANRVSDRTLLRLALSMLLLPAVSWLVFHPMMEALGKPEMWPFHASRPYLETLYPVWDAAVVRGDLATMFRTNADFWVHERLVYFLTSGRPYRVLAMFFLGMWIGRRGIAAALPDHKVLMRGAARWGIALGLPLNVLGFYLAYFTTSPWGNLVEPIGVALLAIGYAGVIGLLLARPAPPKWLTGLAPLGRIALTAYLSQTLICTVLFLGTVTAWYGSLGVSMVMLIVLPVIGVQLLFANWWLARHRQGPMEWIWRRMTGT